jgi:unsaturated rhamnogalacturonyl hydrolase
MSETNTSSAGTEPEDLIGRVVAHTVQRDMEGEDWEKAVALNGLLATGRADAVDAARRLVDRSIRTQTSAGQLSYGSLDYKPWIDRTDLTAFKGLSDPAAVGHSVLEFYDRTGEERYRDAAVDQFEFFETVDRTAEGGLPHHRENTELWVDAVYMQCPFFARYGAFVDDEGFDEAVRQIRIHTERLQDDRSHLFRHAWRETPDMFPSSTYWSRGNGWAAAGIVDTLELLPESPDDVVETFRSLAAGALELQDRSGYWHHILDDPTTALETSGTLMFAYAFAKGVELGYLPADPYADAARRAFEVTKGVVDDEGAVHRVAMPPGGEKMPLGVTSYGQGWFLLAASQLADTA